MPNDKPPDVGDICRRLNEIEGEIRNLRGWRHAISNQVQELRVKVQEIDDKTGDLPQIMRETKEQTKMLQSMNLTLHGDGTEDHPGMRFDLFNLKKIETKRQQTISRALWVVVTAVVGTVVSVAIKHISMR
jgi:hypothetical protein